MSEPFLDYHESRILSLNAETRRLTDERNALRTAGEAMAEALEKAVEIVERDIAEIGPCDHSANLCVCGLRSDLEEMRGALTAWRKAKGE